MEPYLHNEKKLNGLHEPIVPRFDNDFNPKPNLFPNINSKPNPFLNPDPEANFPDWTPNFSNPINIEEESIGLALGTLGLSKAEYQAMDLNELTQYKKLEADYLHSYAINILIHYKKNFEYSKCPKYPKYSNKIQLTIPKSQDVSDISDISDIPNISNIPNTSSTSTFRNSQTNINKIHPELNYII